VGLLSASGRLATCCCRRSTTSSEPSGRRSRRRRRACSTNRPDCTISAAWRVARARLEPRRFECAARWPCVALAPVMDDAVEAGESIETVAKGSGRAPRNRAGANRARLRRSRPSGSRRVRGDRARDQPGGRGAVDGAPAARPREHMVRLGTLPVVQGPGAATSRCPTTPSPRFTCSRCSSGPPRRCTRSTVLADLATTEYAQAPRA
jgi:hypothetical protein